jgi:hypothetical protein
VKSPSFASLLAAAVSGLAMNMLASAPAAAGEACSFYEHRDYEGWSFDVYDGDAVRFVGQERNDQISSIACDPGCSAVVYEDWKFRGRAIDVEDEVAYLGSRWNDRISSIEVSCGY